MQLSLEFVFLPPLIRKTDACDASFIRVPMTLHRIVVPDKDVLVFDFVPAQQGIQAEICEGGP